MDILALFMATTGAFAAGTTVGALVFSPRLITRSYRPETPAPTMTAHQAPAVAPAAVYVAVPPGYGPVPVGHLTTGGQFALVTVPGPDETPIPGVSLMYPAGQTHKLTPAPSAPREVRP